MDRPRQDDSASLATAVSIRPHFKVAAGIEKTRALIPAKHRRHLLLSCGILFIIGTFVLPCGMSGREEGGGVAQVGRFPSRIAVTNDVGGVRIDVAHRRMWLYIVPCAVALAICASFFIVVLRAMVLDRKFPLGGVAALLLLAVFVLGFGYVLLWLTAGRQVILLRSKSFAIRTEILGVVTGAPEVYSSPIKEVRVEASRLRSESGGFKQVEVDFDDGATEWIQDYLDEAEANFIADTIKKRVYPPEAK